MQEYDWHAGATSVVVPEVYTRKIYRRHSVVVSPDIHGVAVGGSNSWEGMVVASIA
jgi:hypothetical protein